MIDRKHNVILTINSEEVGLRFTTWTLKETTKRCGLKGVIELYEKLGSLDIDVWTALVLEGRKEYIYSTEKKDVSITMREASQMIDDYGGLMEITQALSEGVQGHTPKNQAPPQTEGESKSSQ